MKTLDPEDYLLKCPTCGAQSNVDPSLLKPDDPMPYCDECDSPLIQDNEPIESD